MANKPLINSAVLNVDTEKPLENSRIDVSLSIPVELTKEDIKKIGKEDSDLGTISFSEETSNLIREASEAIRKEIILHK